MKNKPTPYGPHDTINIFALALDSLLAEEEGVAINYMGRQVTVYKSTDGRIKALPTNFDVEHGETVMMFGGEIH